MPDDRSTFLNFFPNTILGQVPMKECYFAKYVFMTILQRVSGEPLGCVAQRINNMRQVVYPARHWAMLQKWLNCMSQLVYPASHWATLHKE